MAPISDNFEKLKTLNTRDYSKIFIEILKKNGIEAIEKPASDSGPYEIWVPSDKIFSALGVSAEFDIEIKKRAELKNKDKIEKKVKSKKQARSVKIILALIGIVIIFTIGYRLSNVLVSLTSISKELKPVSIRVDISALKADFASLKEYSKKIHLKKLKSKWNLNSLFFQWNLSKAEKAYNQENFNTAMTKLEKCLSKDRENHAIISLLLTTYFKLNLSEKAQFLLMESYNLPSSDYTWKRWVALQLAEIYLRKKNYFGAEYELNKILEINPDDILILKKLAEINKESDNIHQAIINLERILTINEEEVESRILLGKLLFKLRMFAEVDWNLSKVYEKLTEPDEINEVSLILTETKLNLGELKMAIEYLNQAKIIEDDSERYIFLKSVINYINKNYRASKEDLLKVISINPEFIIAKLYLNLILLHEENLGKFNDSLAEIYDKCDSNDEISLLHYNIACLDLKKGMLRKAWRELMTSYQIDKYLFRKFINDPLIQKIRNSKKYSLLLRQLD